ncbi:hypothetical protein DPMN_164267 [Dreissena polymorpha]|uniref:Uncharacterized protein n=1 Tax=Dreissena polymorpha TaxID=45954 RepID=A0A9D4EUW7_DREPO|nr:hypothetical protein DPMN_164267 [Dreissena polymorpha]
MEPITSGTHILARSSTAQSCQIRVGRLQNDKQHKPSDRLFGFISHFVFVTSQRPWTVTVRRCYRGALYFMGRRNLPFICRFSRKRADDNTMSFKSAIVSS